LTWLLAQHRVWRNCSVRVFVVVENVGSEVAETAAETVRKLFKQKRILANVTVEAVCLSEQMIEPYTYDLTLKMNARHNKAGYPSGGSSLPHTLDDLFRDSVTAEASTDIPSTEPTSIDSTEERSRLRRFLSKAMHPRKTWKERRSRRASRDPPRSLSQAFSRQGTITEDNEKDLLNTLNDRCRQRRAEMDIQHRRESLDDVRVMEIAGDVSDPGYEDDEEDESGSVIGDLQASPRDSSTMFERLNQVILSRSRDSSLVLMNLPDIWGTSPEDCAAYMAFCECLIRGLDKVIFVQSSGVEVVRIL